jgi:hypothetical protein
MEEIAQTSKEGFFETGIPQLLPGPSKSCPYMSNTKLIESGRAALAERLRQRQSSDRKTENRTKTPFAPWQSRGLTIGSPPSSANLRQVALVARNKSAQTTVPNVPEPELNDFKPLVTEYGRSIIKSALDHEPEEAVTLKENIVAAKEKIIVKYKTVENELKIAEGELRASRGMTSHRQRMYGGCIQTSKEDSTRIQDLEKQLKDQSEGKKRSADLLVKETEKRQALEVELADLKKDKKRKRESVAAIWEEAERIKLN